MKDKTTRNKKNKRNKNKNLNENKAERGQQKTKVNYDKKKGKKKQTKKAKARFDLTCLSTACLDNAVKAMKLLKDKVLNFEKQEKRISKKSNIGAKKSEKKDIFKPTLQRLSDAAGGNISSPICSGRSNSSGATKMLNLSMTLKTCAADIHAACHITNLPAVDAAKIAECKTAITIFKNYTDCCQDLSGSDACSCWTPSSIVAEAMTIVKTCDLSKINTAMVNAVKECKVAFGKCRKSEDSVGDIIFACEQSVHTLKLKLKAVSENFAKVTQVALKVSSMVNGTRRVAAGAEDVSTAAAFISICTQINTLVKENPYYYKIATFSTTIVNATVPTFTAENLAALSTIYAALQVSMTTLDTAVSTLGTTIWGNVV